MPCCTAAGACAKVRSQPAGQGKRPIIARRSRAAPGLAETDAAAAEGSAEGPAERALPLASFGSGGGGNAAPGSTPMGWKRCGLEGSPASAGGGARRSDLLGSPLCFRR